MFPPESLIKALRRVASDEEWQEFTSLNTVTEKELAQLKTYLTPAPADPTFRYMRLCKLLTDRACEKLRSGEWQAEAISPAYGPQRYPIDQDLWDLLEITPINFNATGEGLNFVGIRVSAKQSVSAGVETDESAGRDTPGSRRRELAVFLREKESSNSGPVRKSALLKEAKQTISPHISGYLLQQVIDGLRQSGELPEGFFLKGRPKS